MLVDTDNLVPVAQFRKDLEKYINAIQQGGGPVAVTQDSEVVGFFISREEYETMFATAVRELLSSRMKGPTVSQEEARARVRATLRHSAAKA